MSVSTLVFPVKKKVHQEIQLHPQKNDVCLWSLPIFLYYTVPRFPNTVLNSDTRFPTDNVVGYEGNEKTGFFPADNGIYWVGDAGIAASLKDMLAYEIWIDKRRVDLRSVRANVERLKAENPEGSVIIQADKSSKTGFLVETMDQVRLAGVQNVSIAAEQD